MAGPVTTANAASGQPPAGTLSPAAIAVAGLNSLTGTLWPGANGGVLAVASSTSAPSTSAPSGFPNVPGIWVNCCFVAGTPVKTEAGHAPIESLKVGDLVQSEDPKTGAISLRRVTQVHVRPIEKINTFYKLTVSKGGAEEDFYVTGEHPFWIADKAEWRSVDELSVGDALADFGGHRLRVSAKVAVSEKQQTYNISVEGNATYFAGRNEVLVHNIDCGNLPSNYNTNPDGTVTSPAGAFLRPVGIVPMDAQNPLFIPDMAVLERLATLKDATGQVLTLTPTGQFLTFSENAQGNLVQFPVTKSGYPDLFSSQLAGGTPFVSTNFPAANEGASGSANWAQLRASLAFQEAGILTQDGIALTPQAIAASRQIPIAGGQLTNPAVIAELTSDGSNIADWGKYTTQSITLPDGQRSQIHFYMNNVTGDVNLNIDFKVKSPVQ
jgi:hypothetical protein